MSEREQHFQNRKPTARHMNPYLYLDGTLNLQTFKHVLNFITRSSSSDSIRITHNSIVKPICKCLYLKVQEPFAHA